MKTIGIIQVFFVHGLTTILGVPPEFTETFALRPYKPSRSQLQNSAVDLKPAIPFKRDYRKDKLQLQTKNGMSSAEKSS